MSERVTDRSEDETETPGRFRMPDIYVILFVFTAIAALLTHIIPAGQYDRVTLPNGRIAVDPETFRYIDPTPVGFEQFMMAVPLGLIDAAQVVFFTPVSYTHLTLPTKRIV